VNWELVMRKLSGPSVLLLAVVFLGACASQTDATQQASETPACMNYRSMMTAPMPPDAMARLKQACDDSRKQPS
jgi:curli biogenesis system outer membrane secretion channel CsgG